MYEILEDESEKSKKRNYRIYKNPEKVFDEYFYHGIEGRDELLEGIIFFSHNDEIVKTQKIKKIQKKQYNKVVKNKSELERTIDRAREIYLQFYRFVDLNDRDKVPNYYHLENERDLRNHIEEIIQNKLKQLKNSKDDYMFISNEERRQNPQRYDEDDRQRDKRIAGMKEENQVKRNIEAKNKEITRIYSKKIEEEIQSRVEKRKKEFYNDKTKICDYGRKEEIEKEEKEKTYREIYLKINERERTEYYNSCKLKIDDDKMIYSSRERLRYAHFPEGANPDNIQPYIIRHWTENVYDILSYLNELEKTDKTEYYRIWLHTRIERLKNRGHIDDEVRKEIELLSKQEEKIKELQIRKKERREKMEEIRKERQEKEER